MPGVAFGQQRRHTHEGTMRLPPTPAWQAARSDAPGSVSRRSNGVLGVSTQRACPMGGKLHRSPALQGHPLLHTSRPWMPATVCAPLSSTGLQRARCVDRRAGWSRAAQLCGLAAQAAVSGNAPQWQCHCHTHHVTFTPTEEHLTHEEPAARMYVGAPWHPRKGYQMLTLRASRGERAGRGRGDAGRTGRSDLAARQYQRPRCGGRAGGCRKLPAGARCARGGLLLGGRGYR